MTFDIKVGFPTLERMERNQLLLLEAVRGVVDRLQRMEETMATNNAYAATLLSRIDDATNRLAAGNQEIANDIRALLERTTISDADKAAIEASLSRLDQQTAVLQRMGSETNPTGEAGSGEISGGATGGTA